MREPTLQSLIKKHKRRIKTLRDTQVGYDYPDMQAYYDWVELAKMYLRYRFPSNESVVEFCKLSDEPISREQQQRLLAILNAFVKIPTNRCKYKKIIVKLLELARICKRIVQIIWT